jgi:NADH-quinone oxidoreductase subunit J
LTPSNVTPDPKTLILAGAALAAIALWAAMAQRVMAVRLIASAVGAVGLLTVVAALAGPGGEAVDQALFWLFAAGAVGGGVLMITGRDPVHGALWFAVATLCVCGLFMLLSAPFLAAATIIVYAGAIIVTFMFVIMLAQQGGATAYDQRLRLPLPGSLTSFFVLGALAFTLLDWQDRAAAAADANAPATADAATGDEAITTAEPPTAGPTLVAPLEGVDESVPLDLGASLVADGDQMRQLNTLGNALFGKYLLAVELGGTLLLVATIGAIALAPRRQRGNL